VKVAELPRALAVLKTLNWIKSAAIENDYLVVEVPPASAARVNQALAEQGLFASELVSHSTSLESIFLQLTGGAAND
jgi:hypothetical protein